MTRLCCHRPGGYHPPQACPGTGMRDPTAAQVPTQALLLCGLVQSLNLSEPLSSSSLKQSYIFLPRTSQDNMNSCEKCLV